MGFNRRSRGMWEMRKHLDHKDLINTIRLELRHPSEKETIWIIVEGVNDVKLFSKLIDGENVEIKEPYGGVRTLCKVIETLHTESDRIIAIRDADFSRLGVNYTQLDVLFLTDYHDAEMMTLMSDITFQSIISEHLNSYLPQYQSLRRDLLAKLKFLGGLRLFNEKNN
ncbi:DUF4435 domain-containing protein, partial [bacterium]|nr:DUF4435 domain-containing protein [bacterium]